MILSMTGYGMAVVQTATRKITVDVKSLNSKQLDLSVRVPQSARPVENDLRVLASGFIQRGKAELTVTIENVAATSTATLNVEAMAAYKRQFEDAARTLGIDEPKDWYTVLLRMPDVVSTQTTAPTPEELAEQAAEILACARRALDEFGSHRREEGKRLEEFFAERVEKIGRLLAEVPRYESERLVKIRERITDGLQSLPQVDYDRGRLEQEMIFYIEKLDINEEKQRLAQHLRYFIETMQAPEPGQGKKLGFIAQEMGREINTLGSKSNQADMQILVVQMKDLLEQIKEQVLNVM